MFGLYAVRSTLLTFYINFINVLILFLKNRQAKCRHMFRFIALFKTRPWGTILFKFIHHTEFIYVFRLNIPTAFRLHFYGLLYCNSKTLISRLLCKSLSFRTYFSFTAHYVYWFKSGESH